MQKKNMWWFMVFDRDMIEVLMLKDHSTANKNNMEMGFEQWYLCNPGELLVNSGTGEIMNHVTVGKYSKFKKRIKKTGTARLLSGLTVRPRNGKVLGSILT